MKNNMISVEQLEARLETAQIGYGCRFILEVPI